MKPMTEAQAWRYLARRWDRPSEMEDYPHEYGVNLDPHLGLARGICVCIGDLVGAGRIAEGTAEAMGARMSLMKPEDAEAYWWPHSRRGARSRAAFCRRMAKLAAKEAAK